MSFNPALDQPHNMPISADAIDTVIVPRSRDLGGFEVRRALPAAKRQMVGPFIFFDQVGPAEFLTQQGIDVRPHPHIGLATVTYLYQGEFQHKDSLGTDQIIYPGEVNWMIAGNGVTHSERTSSETRQGPSSLFGIQTWVALPEEAEEMDAAFEHHAEDALPLLEAEGKQVRLIVGRAWGERAPTKTFTDMFYADAILQPDAKIPLPDDHEDRGVYVTAGSISVAGQQFTAGQMMVFRPGDAITLAAGAAGARLMLLGGETLNGPRYIWWNFVASSQEKIEAAKQAWEQSVKHNEHSKNSHGQEGSGKNSRFSLPPGDTEEFIPLP